MSEFNIKHGSARGDDELNKVSQFIMNFFKSFLGRLGSDEFVLIVSETNHEMLCSMLKKFQKTKDNVQVLPLSIGGTIVHEPESIEKIFFKSHAALARAKSRGTNQFEIL